MSAEANAYTAARKAFLDGSGLNANVIALPNRQFVPPANATWAQLYFLPVEDSPVEMGDGGVNRLRFILQVDLNFPTGSGETQSALVETVKSLFTPGAVFTYSGQAVAVEKMDRATPRVEASCWRVTLSIRFWTDIERASL